MDQVQEHQHAFRDFSTSSWGSGSDGYSRLGTGHATSYTNLTTGRTGEETRVKNISVRLWKRIS